MQITPSSSSRLILAFTFITIALAVIVNWYLDFDGIIFNGDSFVYFQNAKDFKYGLAHLTYPNIEHWPYGYPALLSLLLLVGETFRTVQWINFIAGGCLIALTGYMILFLSDLKSIDQKKTILLLSGSMLLLAGRGTLLKYQLLIMSDLTGAFFATASMFLTWKWKISKTNAALAMAAVLLGLAMTTRYVYVLMLVPICVILFQEYLSAKKPTFLIVFFSVFLISIIPQLFLILREQPFQQDYSLMNNWSLNNFFALQFESADGHQATTIPNVLYYGAVPFRIEDLSLIGSILVLLGLHFAVRELPRWSWLSLVLWYLSFYILLCGMPIQNPRIAFSLYQPLTLLASFGILRCLNYFRAKQMIIPLLLLFILSVIFSLKHIQKMIIEKNELKRTAEQTAHISGNNSRIISTSLYAVYLAYPMKVEPVSIYTTSVDQVKRMLSDGKRTFLAIDEERFIPQWGNYPAGKTYWWIRDHCRCIPVLKTGGFTIYEVK